MEIFLHPYLSPPPPPNNVEIKKGPFFYQLATFRWKSGEIKMEAKKKMSKAADRAKTIATHCRYKVHYHLKENHDSKIVTVWYLILIMRTFVSKSHTEVTTRKHIKLNHTRYRSFLDNDGRDKGNFLFFRYVTIAVMVLSHLTNVSKLISVAIAMRRLLRRHLRREKTW